MVECQQRNKRDMSFVVVDAANSPSFANAEGRNYDIQFISTLLCYVTFSPSLEHWLGR